MLHTLFTPDAFPEKGKATDLTENSRYHFLSITKIALPDDAAFDG